MKIRLPALALGACLGVACVDSGVVVGSLTEPDGGATSADAGPADAGSGYAGPLSQPGPYRYQGDLTLAGEPIGLTRLPGAGTADAVAVLSLDGTSTLLRVIEPANRQTVAALDFPNANGVALLGYDYETSVGGGAARPILAVAINARTGTSLDLYFFDWDPRAKTLTPHDGSGGLGTPLNEACAQWSCGTQEACVDQQTCQAGQVCSDQWNCGGAASCSERRCVYENISTPGCGNSGPVGCGCGLKVEFGTQVSMDAVDVDEDGRLDLVVATSSDLPFVQYRSGNAGALGSGPGNPTYRSQGCRCGRFAQAPSSFTLANFGGTIDGLPELGTSGSKDLMIGAPGGAFLKYAERFPDGALELRCGQPQRFGPLVPVRHLVRGHFACIPGTTGCLGYEDVVVVAARSLGGGAFDDPGNLRLVFGGPQDLTAQGNDDLGEELLPTTFSGSVDPRNPLTAQVGDVNRDGHDDVGVLYSTPGEIHFWLGPAVSNRGGAGDLTVATHGVGLNQGGSSCNPHRSWILGDFDANGRPDVAVLCNPQTSATLRWFAPTP